MRGPWKRGELARPWKAIREHAGMPEVIPMLCGTRASCAVSERACPSNRWPKIHCDRLGRPRKDGSPAPGAAKLWKRGANGKTRVAATAFVALTLFCCRFDRLVTEVNGTVAERVSVNPR